MKKYIISGSSSGIGKAIATQLLAQGHAIIGLARNHHKYVPDNHYYFPYTIDFADIHNLAPALKVIAKDHPDIDGILCCAGYGRFAELEQFSLTQITDLMNVNFVSQVMLIKSFLTLLKQREQGHIIILGSESALKGEKKGSIYCASKFALRGFSQSLRKECAAANIAVTLINPGFVDTPFFDTLSFQPRRLPQHALDPKHIAELIVECLRVPSYCVLEEINLQPLTKVLEKNAK